MDGAPDTVKVDRKPLIIRETRNFYEVRNDPIDDFARACCQLQACYWCYSIGFLTCLQVISGG